MLAPPSAWTGSWAGLPGTHQRFSAVDGRAGAFGDDLVDAFFVDGGVAFWRRQRLDLSGGQGTELQSEETVTHVCTGSPVCSDPCKGDRNAP